MEKGDRKKVRLMKLYVGTGKGVAGKRKWRFGREEIRGEERKDA
jgi:hypothetical protein